jgi:NAD(P)-dependent dehydrogenase (short-subunit alcohol dehydrogenase family)
VKKLNGKVAVITGGAGVIGQAAAKVFLKEGAKVLLVDLQEELLKNQIEKIGSDSLAYAVADVTQPEQVEHYVKKAVSLFGGIDIFLNNAGIEGTVSPISDYPIEDFDKVMAVNVRGVWLGIKYVMPEMIKRDGGSIVITSSDKGVAAYAEISAYVASKHAIIGIMRVAALEGAPFNVRVNTVNPGPVEGRMMQSVEDSFAPIIDEPVKDLILRNIPLGRYAEGKDVASMMLFLASHESRFCTGGTYAVDGGITLSY